MDIKTICIHGSDWKDPTGCISVPIFQSATFGHPELGQSTGYDYTRVQNPTRECAEKVVCALEHGCDCTSYASGMAAISMVMELFKPGDTILSSDDLYGGSIRLFEHINEKNGLKFRFVNTSRLEEVEKSFDETVKAVYIETPTNPMMQVTDIQKIASLAHEHQALLIADNTFMSPYFCNPIDFGADIVLHSGTKYLAGHNDTLAGFVVCKDPKVAEKVRFLYKTVGGCLAPWDSWLVTRGIKTLALRMEAARKNAQAIAEFLENHPKVTKVLYPGLESFKNRDVHFKQSRGAGAMLSFYTDSHETALKVLKSVRLIRFAESLGGVESLITYPATQTHCDLTEEERQSRGITNCLLRLSVGIEGAEDLIADLKQALA
jgi:cystathionine gamma-synthase